MAGPTETLSTDLKALTGQVADFRAEFSGSQVRVEGLSNDLKVLTQEVGELGAKFDGFKTEVKEFLGRANTIFGFLIWLGAFVALALLGLVGTALKLTWDASKLDSRVTVQSDRLDRLERSAERIAGSVEALTSRVDRLERSVERLAGSVEILVKLTGGKFGASPEKPPSPIVEPPQSSAPERMVQIQTLNDPQASFSIAGLHDGSVRRCVGFVQHVEVGEVGGQSTLDMSGLEAETVKIGRIDGMSLVLVKASKNVTFTGPVDGRSRVVVLSGGDVTFERKIDNQSRVRIKAGATLRCNDKIEGSGTAVAFSAKNVLSTWELVGSQAIVRPVDIDVTRIFDLSGFPF